MKKQTAVDFLMDKLKFIDKNAYNELYNDGYDQAKAMEKEQIVDAHLTGLIHPLEIEASKQAEQYYNKTYTP